MHSFCWRSGRTRQAEPFLRCRATPPDAIQQGIGAFQVGGFKVGEAADHFGGIGAAAHQALQALAGLVELPQFLAEWKRSRSPAGVRTAQISVVRSRRFELLRAPSEGIAITSVDPGDNGGEAYRLNPTTSSIADDLGKLHLKPSTLHRLRHRRRRRGSHVQGEEALELWHGSRSRRSGSGDHLLGGHPIVRLGAVSGESPTAW